MRGSEPEAACSVSARWDRTGTAATLNVAMATPAERIIQKIFEAAAEDERVGPVHAVLRDTHARAEWNPNALAEVVEQATSREMEEASE